MHSKRSSDFSKSRPMLRAWTCWALVILGLGAGRLWAHQALDRTMTAARIESTPPRLDGILDDEIWAVAPIFTGFVQRDPDEDQPATEKTTVQVAYDNEALYVAIMAFDRQPDQIVSRLVRRDQWSEADYVQVALDTHHDHQTGYWFQVNAGGSIQDGLIANDGDGWWSWDDTWDGVWESAHAVHAAGWSVEYRIPYHVLRFSPAEEYTWGVNVTRYVSRKKEQVHWVMVPRKENGWISRFAHLEGIEDITPKRSLEFLPYSVGRSTIAPGSELNSRELFGNIGADLRYGITSGISLNATINPDFGQVEADPAELNLTVFETHQDERRPFFVEGGNSFQTPINLFYSRRIGRKPGYRDLPDGHETVDESDFTTILGAIKVTGKTASKTTFGFLEAVTTSEYARIDSVYAEELTGEEVHQYRDFLTEPWTHSLVGRLKQDLFKGNSHVGLLATALNRNDAEDAYSGGVDWHLKWQDNAYEFWGQLAGSRAGEADDRQSGFGNMAVLGKTSGWLRGHLWWEAFSKGFEVNDLGFQWRGNYYAPWMWVQLRDETPRSIFRQNFFNLNLWGMRNFDGVALENAFNINIHHQFKNYWWIHGEFTRMFRAKDDLDTRGGPLIVQPAKVEYDIEIESDDRQLVSGWLEFEWGSSAAGSYWREAASGTAVRPVSNIEIRLRPRYRWEFSNAQWVENLDDDGDGEDDRFVYGELRSKTLDLTTRVNVLFSRDLSLEFYIQPFLTVGDYDHFKELARPGSYEFTPHPGPEDNPDFRQRSVQSNMVLRWEFRPGSTLFLVWSQFRDDESERARFRPARSVARAFADKGTNVFLVKFNYWMHI